MAVLRMACSCILVVTTAVAQSTWIVDSLGSGSFLDVQPAIAASAAGDSIRVLGGGPYGAFVVDKGIDVEAVANAVCGSIEVLGVPLGQRVRVAGFRVLQAGSTGPVAVHGCQGGVLLADLDAPNSSNSAVGDGIAVMGSRNVVLMRGSYRGASTYSLVPWCGLRLDAATVTVVGTTLLGGVSLQSSSSIGRFGGDAIQLGNGSNVLLGGVTATGANGTTGFVLGGDGGDGIRVETGSAALVVGASHLTGGVVIQGAGAATGVIGHAARGNMRYTVDSVLLGPATTATAIANRPMLGMPVTTLIGSSAVAYLWGAPNDVVWLAYDLGTDLLPVQVLDSVFVLTSGAVFGAVVSLDAAGVGHATVTIPNLLAARFQNVFCQGAAILGSQAVLTAPAVTRTQ